MAKYEHLASTLRNVNTAMAFYNQSQMLKYCKEHSSNETYSSVLKSYKKIMFYSVSLTLVLLLIYAIGLIKFFRQIDSKVAPNNQTFSYKKIGHVGDGVVWYIDNNKYEIDISNFGYDINDYEKRTDFDIYIDDNNNVVDISPSIGYSPEIKMIFWSIGSIIFMSVILLIFAFWMCYSKSKLNPGREFHKYAKWFKNKYRTEDWYNG